MKKWCFVSGLLLTASLALGQVARPAAPAAQAQQTAENRLPVPIPAGVRSSH